MKHLKKFNEEITIEELGKFCDEYLAYLKDIGFDVHIEKDYLTTKKRDITGRNILKKDGIILKIYKKGNKFNLDEIKDDFIPFYQMLKSKYILKDFYNGEANHKVFVEVITGLDEFYLSNYEIVNNMMNIKSPITYIFLKIIGRNQ